MGDGSTLPQGEADPNLASRCSASPSSATASPPPRPSADFAARTLLRGDAMLTDARSSAPHMLGELPGFIADMDAAGAWEPVPTPAGDGRAERPGGPGVLRPHDGGMGARPAQCRPPRRRVLRAARRRPRERRATHDPEGTLLALVRRIVGPDGAGRRQLRPARQRLGRQCRTGERLHRLPHQPASRHARARRRSRRRCCAGCWRARRRTSRASACRSCRPPSAC